MNTKILVTGANGQLASCIKDIESLYSNLNLTYVNHLELDICDKKQVETYFKENAPIHYCINCAAYTDVDKAETDAKKAFDINISGVKSIAKACSENDTVLIHISTDFVFDGNKSEAYIEKDKTNPISVYGKSKLKSEEEILKILKQYFIIRTSWLYSEYGNNFMKTMVKLSREKNELSVVSDQIGTPTYAKDLAEIILKFINTDVKQYGIYNYSNEGTTNWHDFAKAIFELTQISIKLNPIKTEAYPTPAKRPKFSVLDKAKIKQTLGVEIPNWESSLKIAISNLK